MADKSSITDTGALFQIAEPDEAPARRRGGRAIGIDLGTTNSLVAIAPAGAAPRVLLDDTGEALVPSVVAYVGARAVVGRAAQGLEGAAPDRVLASVKRFMGRSVAEIGFVHPYELFTQGGVLRFRAGDHSPSAVEASAVILTELRRRAEAELGEHLDGAVITVPAYFDDAQRQATKDAGRIAGLEVLRLLAEPTAAALAYGLDRDEHGLFAVYDLGGGTFDVSILRLHDGVFQVLATGGDSQLGGDDLDRALAEDLLRVANVPRPGAQDFASVVHAARAAKEGLTTSASVRVDVPVLGLREFELRRERFEELVEPLLRRTLQASKQALRDAGVTADELDGLVLVGGSTRSPAVRRAAARAFGREPLEGVDPERVVAYGAAIQADILAGNPREGVTLLDVVPLSLGIETMGGMVEKLVARNSTIPIAARQVFTNYSEQQTGMTIHVVQGERELAQDCRSLARFELKGIPRLPPSMARVEVTFQVDADALLTVTARELMTGVKQGVEVKPTHGLGEDEVERLVNESLERAKEDFAARDRAEARVELGRVVLAVARALADVGEVPGLLPADERTEVEASLQRARAAMASEDTPSGRLVELREALERASEPFARRRMERALATGMAGRSLGEIEATLADEAALAERRGAHEPARVPPGPPAAFTEVREA